MIKLAAVYMDGAFLFSKKEYNRLWKYINSVVVRGNQYYQLRSFSSEIAAEIYFVVEMDVSNCWRRRTVVWRVTGWFDSRCTRFHKKLGISIVICGCKSAYTSEKESQELMGLGKTYYHR